MSIVASQLQPCSGWRFWRRKSSRRSPSVANWSTSGSPHASTCRMLDQPAKTKSLRRWPPFTIENPFAAWSVRVKEAQDCFACLLRLSRCSSAAASRLRPKHRSIRRSKSNFMIAARSYVGHRHRQGWPPWARSFRALSWGSSQFWSSSSAANCSIGIPEARDRRSAWMRRLTLPLCIHL